MAGPPYSDVGTSGSPDSIGIHGLFFAGLFYAAARWWPASLLVVNVWIVLNWYGDSLDGTLARERNRQRPRYGFYVDHIIDSFGAMFVLTGLAISGYITQWVAIGMLVCFLLFSINSYLATYALGSFRLSFFKFSPTELRALLLIANVVAYQRPMSHVLGREFHFFDVGGVIGIAAMAVVLAISVISNTITLYRIEKY